MSGALGPVDRHRLGVPRGDPARHGAILRPPARTRLAGARRCDHCYRRRVLIIYPMDSIAVLTLVAGCWLIAIGIVDVITAFQVRHRLRA